MNLFGLGRKLLQNNNNNNNKKKSSLDLRKTQSTGNINEFNHPIPVNITFTTPTNLKPILAKSTSQFKPLKEEIEEEEEDHDDNKLNNDSQQSSFNDHISTKSSSLEEFNPDHHQQHENITALSDRLKTITADDMDLLLSLETQARMDHLAEQQEKEKEKRFQQQQQSKKLKFALPDIPLRESSSIYPNHQSKLDSNMTLDEHHHNDYIPIAKRWSLPEETIRQDMKKKNNNNQYFKNSKWMKFLTLSSSTNGNGNNNNNNGNHNQQEENHDQTELKYGCKVKLIRSPIKTTAYVRYVGPVHFAPGEWVGLELERAVGKNDGSVDGQRYFHTGAYRGIFLTRDELLVVK